MDLDCDTRRALQVLARQQLINRLLVDILFDINVCRLEGWDWREFPREIVKVVSDIVQEKRS